MHELDLIPASYKERLKIGRMCRTFGFAFVSVVIILFGLKFAISVKTAEFNARIESLQKDKISSSQQQQQLNELLEEEKKLSKHLEILSGLRGGPPVKQILLAVDRVIGDDVWFTRWSFSRVGEITELQPATVQSGYFIIIPQETADPVHQQAWNLTTHMDISGQAKDHSSLSGFIERLIEQPEIDDVKVINTNVRNYTSGYVVGFNIVVTVNNQFKDGHV